MRLAQQRQFLEQHPDVALLGTRVEAFAEGGSVGEGLERYVTWQNALLTPEDHRRELFVESPLCHPSIMVRRGVLQEAGGYRQLPLPGGLRPLPAPRPAGSCLREAPRGALAMAAQCRTRDLQRSSLVLREHA